MPKYIPRDIQYSFLDESIPSELRVKLREIKLQSIRQRLHKYNPEVYPKPRLVYSAFDIMSIQMEIVFLPRIKDLFDCPDILYSYLTRK